jgi:hypothetical protein
MALRQTRGVVPGILSQEDPGNVVFHYLDRAPTGGKVSASGLITGPLTGDGVETAQSGDPGPRAFDLGAGDPVTETVSNGPGPVGRETKESAGSPAAPATMAGYGLLGAIALGLVFLL